MGSATVSPLEVVCKKVAERLRKMFGIGELPKEYNPKVHGPYDPAIYYGPKAKAFGDVKISELPGWLAGRSKTPVGMGRAMSRAYWRWSHKYVLPKYTGLAPGIQFIWMVCIMVRSQHYQIL